MSRNRLTALIALCLLTTAGCASTGKVAAQPPRLSPVPAPLMDRTDYARKVCEEFLSGSDCSKRSETDSKR